MRAVARRALEDQLDEFLHLVQEGETILVTEHDRVIAELVPPRESGDLPAMNPALLDGVRKGWITPPALAKEPAPPLPPPVAPLEDILRELDEDRADR
ncbi:MAG TPA: prevent-host-death protein [Thermoanaerobaculia bacterium]|nr:prevent-host-death protein [Thermoanaerobaculia bacterium]